MPDEVIMTPGEALEVPLRRRCDFDGFFRVFEADGNKELEHQESPSPNNVPYFNPNPGYTDPLIHFPNPTCNDRGLYHIQYLAKRKPMIYEAVETLRKLRISGKK